MPFSKQQSAILLKSQSNHFDRWANILKASARKWDVLCISGTTNLTERQYKIAYINTNQRPIKKPISRAWLGTYCEQNQSLCSFWFDRWNVECLKVIRICICGRNQSLATRKKSAIFEKEKEKNGFQNRFKCHLCAVIRQNVIILIQLDRIFIVIQNP